MARSVSPRSLENLALDAVIKNYSNAALRIIQLEHSSPENILNWIHKQVGEDIAGTVEFSEHIIELRLSELSQQSGNVPEIHKCPRRLYEELSDVLRRIKRVDQIRLKIKKRRKCQCTDDQNSFARKILQKILVIFEDVVKCVKNLHTAIAELEPKFPDGCYEFFKPNRDWVISMGLYNALGDIVYITSEIKLKLDLWDQYSLRDSGMSTCTVRMCRQLHETLQTTIPPSYADKVTAVLIENVKNLHLKKLCPVGNVIYIHVRKSCPIKLPENITIVNLMRAIIHPALTKLDLGLYNPTFYREILYREMKSMENIVVLKLEVCIPDDENVRGIILSGIQVMKYLEILHLIHNCTNDMLEVLVKTSLRLKCLNISKSRHVTEDCSRSLEELRYLEEVNIVDTGIKQGLAQIIKAVAQNRTDLSENTSTKSSALVKSFGCNISSVAELPLLVSEFRNVKELEIQFAYHWSCDVAILKDLQFLESLILHYCEFSNLTDVLVSKGRQLLKLAIVSIRHVDAEIISINCPALTHLEIKKCHVIRSKTRLDNVIFPALEDLNLYNFRNEGDSSLLLMLCGCPKLRVLKIVSDSWRDLDNIIERRVFQNVEDLTLRVSWPIDRLREIIDQCDKLTKLTYFDLRNTLSSDTCELGGDISAFKMEWFMKKVKAKYVGLSISRVFNTWASPIVEL